MKTLNCPACGGTILTEPYRALDTSEWCERCAGDAQRECETNSGPEIEHGAVDLHAEVLDMLRHDQEVHRWELTQSATTHPSR